MSDLQPRQKSLVEDEIRDLKQYLEGLPDALRSSAAFAGYRARLVLLQEELRNASVPTTEASGSSWLHEPESPPGLVIPRSTLWWMTVLDWVTACGSVLILGGLLLLDWGPVDRFHPILWGASALVTFILIAKLFLSMGVFTVPRGRTNAEQRPTDSSQSHHG